MKNFNFFDKLFGTVGSPNQTDETQTRENRIGLKSYLRRTIMLLFAVLVMSIANIGTAWGAGTAIADLNFNAPTSLPSNYTYSTTNTPTITTFQDVSCIVNGNGGSQAPSTWSADNSEAPSGGKRWLAFQPAVDCRVTLKVGKANDNRTFYLMDKDHNSHGSPLSSYNPSAKNVWEESWSVSLTSGTWYAITNYGSNGYIASMQFVANPTFSESAGAELAQNEGTVTLTASGTTIYYKWSTSSSAYNADAGSSLFSAADGNGTSPKTVTAPDGTGTYYLYAVAKRGNYYSDVVKRSYTIVEAAASNTYTYTGQDNSWGSTAMTVSDGGLYEYIHSTRQSDHQFKIKEGNNYYNWTYTFPGFCMTNLTTLGNQDGDNCKVWDTPSSYYIIVFKPNTTLNSSSNPRIATSTTLPDDTEEGLAKTKMVYLVPGSGWETSSPKYAVYYEGHSRGWSDYMTASPCIDGAYQVEIPALFSSVQFMRMNPEGGKSWNDGDYWNYTAMVTMPTNKPKFTVNLTNANWNSASTDGSNWSTVTTYTISFNANKGSGSISSITGIDCNTSRTLPTNTFTRTGWTFVGWNTDKYGGGTSYADGATISNITSNITLYAQWQRKIYFYSTTINWYDDDAKTQLHCWDNDDNTKNLYVTMTRSDDCSNPIVYEATIPGGGYDKLQFKRLKSDESESWNETVDLDFNSSYNMYKLTNMSGGEGGKAYGANGFDANYSAPSQYTITFAANGGDGSMSAIEDICEETDQDLTANSYSKTGYDFAGWKTNAALTYVAYGDDDDGTHEVSAAVNDIVPDKAKIKEVGSNITLTAQWTAKTCTLSYKDEGHAPLTGIRIETYPSTHTYGSSTALTKATRDGYVFGGWYKDKECTNGPITSIGATDYDCSSNIYLYAKWTAMNLDALADNTLYKVEDMVPDGITPGSDVRRYPGVSENNRFNIRGSSASSSDADAGMTPRSHSKEVGGESFSNMYRFDKPASGTKGTNLGTGLPDNHAIQFKISAAGKLDIYCYYGDSIYIVKDGGSAEQVAATNSYQKVTKPVTAGTYYLYSVGVTDNQRLYGLKFTPKYAITHSDATNGSYTIKVGSAAAVSTSTNSLSGETITLAATPSSGYVIDAWNVTGATVGNNNIASTTFTMPAGNVTVAPTFKLMPNVYYYQDGTRYASSTYKAPDGSVASSGNNQAINSGNEWTVSNSISGLTVSAKGCTYDGKSGSEIHETAYLKVPKDGNASNQYVKFVVAAGYKATSLKMKIGGYSSNPAVTLKPYTTELGDAISYTGTVGGVATKENNFNEISWSNLAAGTYYLNVGTNAYISEITAQTESTGYVISFAGNGNTGGSTASHTAITSGADVTLNSNGYTKTGYDFSHWTANVDVTVNSETVDAGDPIEDGATIENVTSNIALTAQWTIQTFDVTFAVSPAGYGTVSGNTIADVPYNTSISTSSNSVTINGSTITATAASQTAQYTYAFDSWSNASGNVTAERTITANFTRSGRSYTVTLNKDGGTIKSGNVTSYTYGVGATLPTDVTRSGYTFDGWHDNSGLTGDAVTTIADDATGNKEYWAKWTALSSIPCLDLTELDEDEYWDGDKTYDDAVYEFTEVGDTEEGPGWELGEPASDDEANYIHIGALGIIKEVKLTIEEVGASNADASASDKGISYYFGEEGEVHFATDEYKKKDNLTAGTLSLRPTSGDFNAFVFKPMGTSLKISNICIYYTDYPVYTVSYNAMGGTCSPTTENTTTVLGKVTLPSATNSTYDLVWVTSDGTEAGAAGDKYKTTSDVTLYAKWQGACAGDDPILSIGALEGTTSTFLKTYSTEGITISSSSEWGIEKGTTEGLVKLESSGTYNTNYLEVLASSYNISKVSFLLTGNGTSKELQPVVFGWATTASGATAATYRMLDSKTVSNKGYSNAEWFTYDLSESSVKCIHLYKNSKNISSTNPEYTGSSDALGGNNTIWVYGIKVWLDDGSSSGCYTVTYDGNGATSGYVNDPTQYAEDATVYVSSSTGSYTRDGGYEFNGWNTKADGSGDKIAYFTITKDTTLYAQWRIVVNSNTTNLTAYDDPKHKDVRVTNGATLTLTQDTTVRNITVETGSTLNVNTTNGDGSGDGITLTANSLSLVGGWDEDKTKYDMPRVYIASGSAITREEKDINFDIAVDNSNYYPIAVPFDVSMSDVTYKDPTLATAAATRYGTIYAVKTYDGQDRAEGNTAAWTLVGKDKTLKPGHGYILCAVPAVNWGENRAIITFPMKNVPDKWLSNGELGQYSEGTPAVEHIKDTVHVTAYLKEGDTDGSKTPNSNKGWNLLGVPYMSCYSTNDDMYNEENVASPATLIQGRINFADGKWKEETVRYVTVPTYDFSEYHQYNIDPDEDPETVLMPGWCFFIQVAETGYLRFLAADERAEMPIYARREETPMPTVKTGIILSSETASDKTTILISDKYSAAEYEINADLEKMFGENSYTLATYSLSNETRLAYNAMSRADAANVIPIGYRAPAEGEYTFAINPRYAENGDFERIDLIDYETGFVTNLLQSSYTFTSDRTQSDSRFALNVVPQKETPTDVEPVTGDGLPVTGARKVIIDNKLYIILNGKMYDAKGVMVK